MNKSEQLRRYFRGKEIIRVMGACNALGAKLVERVGFDAVWVSGFEISTSFGVPDANILTMTDFLNIATSMNEVVSIPIIADCDTGFGNSNNVIHMVKKYEGAGAAAVCIEDKRFPKVNSFIPGRQELAPVAEFVGKILAAKNAQSSTDFVVIARVEALIAGWPMEEALKRASAYQDAGADAILIHSKSRTPHQIFEFVEKWKGKVPIIVIPTTYYNVKLSDLKRKGIKMVIYANQGIRASIKAMEDTLKQIHAEGSTRGVEEKIASLKEVFDIQGMPRMKENELLYVRTDRENLAAIITSAGDHLEEYSMKHISSEIPICMLDINGKTFLQRQIEILNRNKIYNIYVVGGYKKEKIDINGFNLVLNLEYKKTGILYSVMCALKQIEDKVFITYGDVLFDHIILSRLLDSREDITIIVDNTFDSKNYGPERIVDLAISMDKPQKTKRTLHKETLSYVKRIGTSIKPEDAQYEFPGFMLLSKKGVQIFKETYKKCSKIYTKKPFHSAISFEKANISDLLQEIINSGFPVYCLEVNSGWLEVHSLGDYKLACSLVK